MSSPRHKPILRDEVREVVYSGNRWRLLEEKRGVAKKLMELLSRRGLDCIVHGSVARGDVSFSSDVDVFITRPVSSYVVELALESGGWSLIKRVVVQATPKHTPKAYLFLDPEERVCVSFPLLKLSIVEREFYRFGGELTYDELLSNQRVVGVDKRLMLIEPTSFGHREMSVLGREDFVARLLGVSVDTVRDRVNALMRRERAGRTGVFFSHALAPSESFETILRRLAESNPFLKKRML